MPNPTACGCHIYSGGFTTGIRNSFDIAGQWEEIPAGAATFELNFPGIRHPTSLADWPLDEFRGRLELFYGNPPCAIWSNAGSRLGTADPRIQFTANAMNAALELEPEFFVLESVPRAWSPNGGRSYYTDWASKFNAKGYGVTVLLTNALLHGAAQSRERFHFIAHRSQLSLREPRPRIDEIRTVYDAIHDLAKTADTAGDPNHVTYDIKPAAMNVIERLKPSESWYEGYSRALAEGLPASKNRFIAHRLNYETPAATVLDISALVHPTENRLLTLREGARLCGYPDWFRFLPNKFGGNNSEVTQAVMPPVGDWLGKMFLRSLDIGRDVELADREGVHTVDWRPIGKPFSPRRYPETLRQFTTRA